MAPVTRERGRGRTLAIGIPAILATGLVAGFAAEVLRPAGMAAEAAATGITPEEQRDASTRQSLVAISEAVETYYVSGSGALTLAPSPTEAALRIDGHLVASVPLAEGTRIGGFHAGDYSTWCIDAVNEQGTGRTISISADQGIASSPC